MSPRFSYVTPMVESFSSDLGAGLCNLVCRSLFVECLQMVKPTVVGFCSI